jgi:hypothetical protein
MGFHFPDSHRTHIGLITELLKWVELREGPKEWLPYSVNGNLLQRMVMAVLKWFLASRSF